VEGDAEDADAPGRVLDHGQHVNLGACPRVLNAMREDLTDLRSRVDDGLAEMRNGFTEMRGKLDAAAAGQQQIVGLLNTLIDRGEDS
jgi:hypothetical protein